MALAKAASRREGRFDFFLSSCIINFMKWEKIAK